jgi:hypothetical protein
MKSTRQMSSLTKSFPLAAVIAAQASSAGTPPGGSSD